MLAPEEDLLDLEGIVERISNMHAMWVEGTPEQRRDLAQALFDTVWVDLDSSQVIAVQVKKALQRLRSALRYNVPLPEGENGQMRTRRDSSTPQVYTL